MVEGTITKNHHAISENMQPSRSLLAFAVIADSFATSGDLVQGLMPLFAPIAADLAGERFDAKRLCVLLNERYDFEIPIVVVEDWAKRLETAGFLENVSSIEGIADYRYLFPAEPLVRFNPDELEQVIEQFKSFVLNNAAKVHIGEDTDLALEFYNRLIRIENLMRIHTGKTTEKALTDTSASTLRLKKKDLITVDDIESDTNITDRLDFLFGRFIEELDRKSDGSLDLLGRISAGAMFAEVVLSFQSPPKKGDALNDVEFFLDAPLAMDLLGLDPHREGYAKELLQALKSVDAKVSIFDHSVAEIDRAIHARTSDSSGRQRVQTALQKILLSNLKGRVAKELEKLGISVMRFQGDAYERSLAYFTLEQENQLFSALNFHNNEPAQSADARSIATIERLRRNRRISLGAPLLSAGPVLVTRNTALASACRRAIPKITNSLGDSSSSASVEADLCILDRFLSGLLWIIGGGSAQKLPYSQLIANCATAVAPKRAVIKKAITLLSSINKGQADTFEAIIQDERAEHYLADLTLNDASLVTEDNISEIYEKVRVTVGIETEERLKAEFSILQDEREAAFSSQIREIENEHEQESNRINKVITQLQDEVKQGSEQYLTLKIQLKDVLIVNSRLRDEINAETERKHKCLVSSLTSAQKIGKFVPFVIGLLLAVALYLLQDHFGSLNEQSKNVMKIGTGALTILSFVVAFWDTPQVLFGRLKTTAVRQCYNISIRLKGLDDFALKYPVNWQNLTIPSANTQDRLNEQVENEEKSLAC